MRHKSVALALLTVAFVAKAHAGDFVAPDSGEKKTAYTCTFHWFRAGDRVVGLDVIRSDDTEKRGLRVFVTEKDGSIRALIHEAPTSSWAPFASDARPALDGTKNVLGRGKNWISGSVNAGAPSPQISKVRFLLRVTPKSEARFPLGIDPAVVDTNHLNAIDWTSVRTQGWIEIDGERFSVDALGPCSIHYGDKLPAYAYIATVPDPKKPNAPSLLLAAVAGDNLRAGVFSDATVTYSYGSNGVPKSSVAIRGPLDGKVKLDLFGKNRIELADVKPLAHSLLGVETTTASARATLVTKDLVTGKEKRLDLGLVVVDARGSFVEGLRLKESVGLQGALGAVP